MANNVQVFNQSYIKLYVQQNNIKDMQFKYFYFKIITKINPEQNVMTKMPFSSYV